jgi:cysteine desulfurase/selenocysteine lyase
MSSLSRIYFDHAATSWPKSDAVLDAMIDFSKRCGVAAGRGGYQAAVEADQVVTRVRKKIASLIDAQSASCISFHANGTAALNVAIYGMLSADDHVVVSAAEHNSVLRPLHDLERRGVIRLTVVPVCSDGSVDANVFINAVQEDTRLAVLTHASNVTGAMQPVSTVGAAIRATSTYMLCDAAQTFGAVPVSVDALNVDLLAAPGHKSSGGPLGTAFLYVSPKLHHEFRPLMFGGTGSQSESLEMPREMPSKLEPGNLNVPAIAGWEIALTELVDLEMREKQHREISQRLIQGLRAIPGLTVHASDGPLPIASATLRGLSPSDFAAILDAEFGVEVRAGLHCAAFIHQYLGTQREGTVRFSGSASTTGCELQAVLDAVSQIVQEISDS